MIEPPRGRWAPCALSLLLAAVLSCSVDPRPVAPPLGAELEVDEDAQVERIVALLRSTAGGRATLRDAGDPRPIRIGGRESALVGESTIVLCPAAHDHDDRAMAARLGHLLLHRAEARAFEPPVARAACAVWSTQLAERERRAHALEDAIAHELGVPLPARSIEALETAYRTRCEREATR